MIVETMARLTSLIWTMPIGPEFEAPPLGPVVHIDRTAWRCENGRTGFQHNRQRARMVRRARSDFGDCDVTGGLDEVTKNPPPRMRAMPRPLGLSPHSFRLIAAETILVPAWASPISNRQTTNSLAIDRAIGHLSLCIFGNCRGPSRTRIRDDMPIRALRDDRHSSSENPDRPHHHPPGTRRHIKGALAAGATVEEVMEVLKACVVQGVQACNLAVPILAEELARSSHMGS
jgi:hypothetical protein